MQIEFGSEFSIYLLFSRDVYRISIRFCGYVYTGAQICLPGRSRTAASASGDARPGAAADASWNDVTACESSPSSLSGKTGKPSRRTTLLTAADGNLSIFSLSSIQQNEISNAVCREIQQFPIHEYPISFGSKSHSHSGASHPEEPPCLVCLSWTPFCFFAGKQFCVEMFNYCLRREESNFLYQTLIFYSQFWILKIWDRMPMGLFVSLVVSLQKITTPSELNEQDYSSGYNNIV